MLPQQRRLRSRPEHLAAQRQGRRRAAATLVVHVLRAADAGPARAGFVVARTTGDAVTRNRVKRRLRHLVATRLDHLPAGTLLVVRARPAAAAASSQVLGTDLDAALTGLGVLRP